MVAHRENCSNKDLDFHFLEHLFDSWQPIEGPVEYKILLQSLGNKDKVEIFL